MSSLPDHPIAVGFDVDDTVLFSSPGYFYGLTNRDGPEGTNRYGEDPLSSPEFWSDMNAGFDRFSLPKEIGRVLLDLHKARGDTIYFITARTSSPGETLTPLLNRTFGLENTHAVIFVGRNSKVHPLRDLGIELYYGDADDDIEQATAAGVRGVRVIRSKASYDPRPFHPGIHGEEILRGSDY